MKKYDKIITKAKKLRSEGKMLSCLEELNKLKEDTAESLRLRANTLVDMASPYSASYFINTKYRDLPKEKQSEIDNYKNLDVRARILYKLGRYQDAIELIQEKIKLSEDRTRELPFLLWVATVAKDIELATSIAKELIGDKNIVDLPIYHVKSLTLYDRMFNLNKFRRDAYLIMRATDVLGGWCDSPVDDNGPFCYTLVNIGYGEKRYMRAKFWAQKYYFESSIIDGVIPEEFLEARRELYNEPWYSPYDRQRENLYIFSKNEEDMIKYGIFPL